MKHESELLDQSPEEKQSYAYSNRIRTNSDPRILDRADLQMASKKSSQDGSLADKKSAAIYLPSLGITTVMAEQLLKLYGMNELPEYVIPKWYIFVSQLWQVCW